MLDFILGLYLAALAVRGWVRGSVKEALDLAGLVVGVFVGFRVSAPVGDFLADRFGVTPEWARLGAGIVIFVLVGVGFSILAATLGRFMSLPGLNLTNRLLGTGIAMAWGVFLILVLVAIVEATQVPDAITQAIDESTVLTIVAGEDAVPRDMLEAVAGDDVIGSLLALKSIAGEERIVLDGDDVFEMPPTAGNELAESQDEATEVFDLLNDERVASGRAPLASSDGLAAIARDHAFDMYLNGFVSHMSPSTGGIADRVERSGIRLSIVGENLALASSTRAVHDGFVKSASHRRNMLQSSYDRVGVAAVDGPYGLMVVQVFGG
jgi:uncharacterized protein YkwD/uncharacterized membrane protein required for colicin V production